MVENKTITCLETTRKHVREMYNLYPIKPNFFIENLGFVGLYYLIILPQ